MSKCKLYHHGVKGMKWGVRRYQNKDGSLTYLGIARKRATQAAKTKSDVDSIIDSMSNTDKRKLGLNDGEGYLTVQQGEWVVKRILLKHGNKPIAFFDLLRDGDNLDVVIGTHAGDEYRGKGYGTQVARKGLEWCEKNKDKWENITWGARSDNAGSIRIAEKLGFELEKEYDRDGHKWKGYRYGN